MTNLIREFGIFGVFLLMVPESACIPIPSELTLLFSGFAVRQGWISLPLAIAAATAGNLAGSLLAYGAGATGALNHIPGARQVIDRWAAPIERHGERAILYARLLPLARTFVALPAGALRVRLRPFILYTVIGSAAWALAFVALGVLVGAGWQKLDSVLGRGMLLVGLLVIAITVQRGSRQHRRKRGCSRSYE